MIKKSVDPASLFNYDRPSPEEFINRLDLTQEVDDLAEHLTRSLLSYYLGTMQEQLAYARSFLDDRIFYYKGLKDSLFDNKSRKIYHVLAHARYQTIPDLMDIVELNNTREPERDWN